MIVEELQKMSIPKISNWFETPQGRYILSWEKSKVDQLVTDQFGFNAFQFGMSQCAFLDQNRIPLRQIAGEGEGVDLICNFHEIPLATNSVDLVVMPHILEFHKEPHQILREVERILIADGQLIITGFNPISLWGLRQKMHLKKDVFPFNGNYISVLRLRDWLKLLSFEVDRGHFGCYIPPFKDEQWIRRWHFMEAAGDRWWSVAGGVYLIRAIKRVRGMRLIMPEWQTAKAAQKGLVVSKKEVNTHE